MFNTNFRNEIIFLNIAIMFKTDNNVIIIKTCYARKYFSKYSKIGPVIAFDLYTVVC